MNFRKPRLSAQLAQRAKTTQPKALEGAVLAITRAIWKLQRTRTKYQNEIKRINRQIADTKKELRTLLRTEISIELEPKDKP